MSVAVDRRAFLAGSAAAAALLPQATRAQSSSADSGAPIFHTANAGWQAAYDKALAVLAGNVRVMPYVSAPVLIEGATYQGIWQECGPHEALVYRHWRPDVARNSQTTFFDLQRANGQLPANNKVAETGFGQIQMVVPIAATAWELAQATGDDALLAQAYRACAAWDGWLVRHRNTRGTGLVEGFCTYDTGHDNSPRWAGLPNQCPNKDAAAHHPLAALPRLCPDLSATVFGGRRALAAMARALGRGAEADRWEESAETMRRLILSRLYSAEDAAFYDRDPQGRFVRIRGDVISRVCGEHVVDQATFDHIWQQQLGNPEAFWSPVPLPSIALDDPSFVRPIPANSWGGAAQALTALRAGRWFDHYRRSAEFTTMMDAWCDAIQADSSMRQQVDPLTGRFTQQDQPGYSPAALVMLDYTWRLVGVRADGDLLHWNVRPHHPAAQGTRLALRTDGKRKVEMRYDGPVATLGMDGREIARVRGGAVRLVTRDDGTPVAVRGIAIDPQSVTLDLPGQPPRQLRLAPNQDIAI
ncbi:alpha-L-rhamnosidase [uncultured Sphingomonas sp.]|uniref:MGH1-like glycoside hydrolase domain-containing protein n=1 Tax=uncultured Sphingomonas sp. TaxID=158754 RepID=UPI0025E32106|nr:alpha-L-rhamnosidase [uncultured Sphingomonas sp.]